MNRPAEDMFLQSDEMVGSLQSIVAIFVFSATSFFTQPTLSYSNTMLTIDDRQSNEGEREKKTRNKLFTTAKMASIRNNSYLFIFRLQEEQEPIAPIILAEALGPELK